MDGSRSRHPGAKMVVVGKCHDERSRPPCRLPRSVLISPSTGFKSTASTPQARPVVKRRLRRSEVVEFFKGLEPCLVGMEACATAHHWARELIALGARGEADAAGLCEGLCQAQQKRRGRRRGDLRGGDAALDALRAGQGCRSAIGADAASGPQRC